MSNKKIYICSRYSHKTTEERTTYLNYARNMSREAVLKGFTIACPHLLYPQFMNDKNPTERELGMSIAIKELNECDIIIVGTKYGISDGMNAEIKEAEKKGIEIMRICETSEIKDI